MRQTWNRREAGEREHERESFARTRERMTYTQRGREQVSESEITGMCGAACFINKERERESRIKKEILAVILISSNS